MASFVARIHRAVAVLAVVLVATLPSASSAVLPGLAAPGTITTAAGGPVGGLASAIGIVPHGVAFHNGDLYFSDASAMSVRRVDLDTGLETIVAGTGEKLGGNQSGVAVEEAVIPGALAFDASGNLLVVDTFESELQKISPDGRITRVISLNGVACGPPSPYFLVDLFGGLAVDARDHIFVGNFDRVCEIHPDGAVTLAAGGGTLTGEGAEGAPSASVGLEYVTGIAVAPDGTLYIAQDQLTHTGGDGNRGAVRKVAPDGTFTTVAPDLRSPEGLLLDDSGRLYISEMRAGRVVRRDLDGTLHTLIGSGAPGGWTSGSSPLAKPMGMTFHPTSGALVVADAGLHRIRSFAPGGAFTDLAGNGFAAFSGDGGPAYATQLGEPWGIATDRAGAVYIADSMDSRVRRIGRDGRITTVAGNGTAGWDGDGGPATAAQLLEPQAVALDDLGNLYISDTGSGRVRRVGLDGRITTVAGGGSNYVEGQPATSAYISPSGLAIGPLGTLYIADWAFNRIREVRLDGTIRTVAGTGEAGYSGDGGLARLARLDRPRGIAFDRTGNLYIVDSENDAVRKVSPLGVISTVLSTYAPYAVTVDTIGRVLVSGHDGRIFRIGLDGQSEALPGSTHNEVSDAARFHWPLGLASTADGTVWIAQPYSSRVRTLTTNPFGLLPAPLGIQVLAGNGFATVSWSAAFAPDGTPALGYTVTATSGGVVAVRQIVAGDVSAVSLPGLRNGTQYEVTVAARLPMGTSATSVPRTVTPSALGRVVTNPTAPRNLSVVPRPGGLSTRWSSPAGDGGSPVVAYSLVAQDSRTGAFVRWLNVESDVRQASVDALAPTATYVVTLLAWTQRGLSVATALPVKPSAATAPATPSAPSFATATMAGGLTAVRWGAPADDGGHPILGYAFIVVRGGQVVSWTNALATARTAFIPTPATDTTLVIAAATSAGIGATLIVAPT